MRSNTLHPFNIGFEYQAHRSYFPNISDAHRRESDMDQTAAVSGTSALAGAIRNPERPEHLMVIKPIRQRIRVYAGDTLLADSTSALRVMEIGKSLYHPVVYVPEDDLIASFGTLDKTTHCPIKGNASYVAIEGEEIAWVYRAPIRMAALLKDHYAFWPEKIRLVEGD